MQPSELEKIQNTYDLYTGAKVKYSETKTKDNLFRDFYLSFAKFKSRLGTSFSDPYWIDFMRVLSRYRFRCAVSPLPFNEKSLFGDKTIETIQEGINDCRDVFAPEFENHAFNLLDTVKELLQSTQNPYQVEIDKLCKEFYGKKVALVLKSLISFEIVSEIYSENKYLEILTETQFKKTNKHYSLVIFLGHETWYDHYVFTIIKSPNVVNIFYDFIGGKKTESLSFSHPIWDRNITVVTKDDDYVPNKYVIYDSPEELSNEIQLNYIQSKLDITSSGRGEEKIEARLTDLSGGYIVFLRNHKGLDTTQDILLFGNEINIERKEVSKIQPGDFIILRTSGDKDLILEEANKLLGSQSNKFRELQKSWKEKLNQYVKEHTETITIKKLKQLGVNAYPAKLHDWLSERNIKPRKEVDFKKLLSLINIEGENFKKYWETMSIINSKHITAGTVVRKKILNIIVNSDLSELNENGLQRFTLSGTTASISVFRVIRIAKENIMQWVSQTDTPINIKEFDND